MQSRQYELGEEVGLDPLVVTVTFWHGSDEKAHSELQEFLGNLKKTGCNYLGLCWVYHDDKTVSSDKCPGKFHTTFTMIPEHHDGD